MICNLHISYSVVDSSFIHELNSTTSILLFYGNEKYFQFIITIFTCWISHLILLVIINTGSTSGDLCKGELSFSWLVQVSTNAYRQNTIVLGVCLLFAWISSNNHQSADRNDPQATKSNSNRMLGLWWKWEIKMYSFASCLGVRIPFYIVSASRFQGLCYKIRIEMHNAESLETIWPIL